MTATEWIVVNGHVLGQCAYLRSLDDPWYPDDQCDCRDLLEDDEDEEIDYGWWEGEPL